MNLFDLRSIVGCPGGTRSVFTCAFRAKRELHCIFLGKKAIILTSKHGTTIFSSPLQSTLSKTDTFGTGTKCPCYKESNKGSKERQGPTLSVRFTEVSVKRESTVQSLLGKLKEKLAQKARVNTERVYRIVLIPPWASHNTS